MSTSGKNNLNNMEKEVLILKAYLDMVDDIINNEMLELKSADIDGDTGLKVCFSSWAHQKVYNIILVDILSNPDPKIFPEKLNYIDYLYEISNNPNFDSNNSVNDFKSEINKFKIWLETEIERKTYFPSIEKEIDFKIKRSDILKLCGNNIKHNFTRLTANARYLKKIFKSNNITITDTEAIVMIKDDFYLQFQDGGGILSYYDSIVVEFLNNIKYEICKYLTPQYYNSFKKDSEDDTRYTYIYPDDIQNDLAKHYYFELMNDIRNFQCSTSAEYRIPKFNVPEYLKKYY